MGRATRSAIGSGFASAIRFGTISPTTRVRYVITRTTTAKAIVDAYGARTGILGHKHREARREDGSAVRPREDADHGDPDLNGREEPVRLGRELERGPCAGVAILAEGLEPVAPGRDDRELGHGEETVGEDQETDDRGLEESGRGYVPPRCAITVGVKWSSSYIRFPEKGRDQRGTSPVPVQ